MEKERFERFDICINAIAKRIRQLKTLFSGQLGVKGVHTFWLYILLSAPDGLTAAEIATRCQVNPSLISREIEELEKKGLLRPDEEDATSHRKYNARYALTDEGREVARAIQEIALDVQNKADLGISPEELSSFYATLEKLVRNFDTMVISISPNKEEKIRL